ncbi:hypothetical protein [Vagococcus luciliae]|uniref:DUF2768 domain-containing protein n=1 Tax=Vagococcus luciliae TaxID=2920380 RepID=A0ABY5P267_9ENTE|nr:hypothetical protein [Vagococcus luciliae]UUV99918.1 hypothetical protein G314FT_20870 [Vagococcus luciliae]
MLNLFMDNLGLNLIFLIIVLVGIILITSTFKINSKSTKIILGVLGLITILLGLYGLLFIIFFGYNS